MKKRTFGVTVFVSSGMVHGALMACFLCSGACRADAIPTDRRIPWAPGIPVSVPIKPDTVSVMTYGARGDSSADDHAAFKAAIDALPASGGVVKIP